MARRHMMPPRTSWRGELASRCVPRVASCRRSRDKRTPARGHGREEALPCTPGKSRKQRGCGCTLPLAHEAWDRQYPEVARSALGRRDVRGTGLRSTGGCVTMTSPAAKPAGTRAHVPSHLQDSIPPEFATASRPAPVASPRPWRRVPVGARSLKTEQRASSSRAFWRAEEMAKEKEMDPSNVVLGETPTQDARPGARSSS